jgi:hypothetical protein
VWVAALGPRSCAACVAMHGSFHPVTERLDGHPNCRCTMVPRTKAWEDLGLEGVPDTRPQVGRGGDWLDEQPEAVRREILGVTGAEAYDRLEVDVQDFVGRKQHARWGSMRHARSLTDALAKSGMPKVDQQAGPERDWPTAPRLDVKIVRRAIRRWREKAGDVRGMEVRVVPEQPPARGRRSFAWVTSDLPHVVRLPSAEALWADQRREYLALYQTYAATGLITDRDYRNLLAALPSNYADRVAESLLHEQGHTLTLQREGDYRVPGFDWATTTLPADLLGRIKMALAVSLQPESNELIGEVLAEDARRFRSGPSSRLSSVTYSADAADLGNAFRRARDVWNWMTGP